MSGEKRDPITGEIESSWIHSTGENIMNETDPTVSHKEGWTGAEEIDAEEIVEDLKSLEEMEYEVPNKKGLRHTPSMYAAKKRKQKIALQKAARKRQRGK